MAAVPVSHPAQGWQGFLSHGRDACAQGHSMGQGPGEATCHLCTVPWPCCAAKGKAGLWKLGIPTSPGQETEPMLEGGRGRVKEHCNHELLKPYGCRVAKALWDHCSLWNGLSEQTLPPDPCPILVVLCCLEALPGHALGYGQVCTSHPCIRQGCHITGPEVTPKTQPMWYPLMAPCSHCCTHGHGHGSSPLFFWK